jgi:acyl-CoA synthetase
MHVRLLNPETFTDVPPGENEGQPACKGPATALGYWGDQEANTKLFTDDGWMLMGDIVRIDDDGVLSVIGRTSDFIIRGGKNISAPAVEAELATHPSVAMVAAVAFPDPVFGERVCAYVELRPDTSVTLEELVEHMRARSVSREWWPEHLVVVDELPRSSGGKVAKGDLKIDARRRSAQLHAGSTGE